MIRARLFLITMTVFATASCKGTDNGGAIAISAIGAPPKVLQVAGPPSVELVRATAQGLVAFDADGQVEPGLAERWIVTGDGLSTIFRLRRVRWSNGRDARADEVVGMVRAVLARAKVLIGPSVDVIAMTGNILEVRLTVPQPALLQLLAQPDMAILRGGSGTGPYRIHRKEQGAIVLRPAAAPDGADDDLSEAERKAREVYFRGEGAGRAVARFMARRSDAVLDGTFTDLPIARSARPSTDQLTFDPTSGLFGLAFTDGGGFASDVWNRQALAMAIDRDRIVRAFSVPGWQATETLLPAQLDSATEPAAPAWRSLSFADRVAGAAHRVTEWRSTNGVPPILKVAVPSGPGARLLFAMIADDWQHIGIRAVAVDMRAAADLRLIDEVAPNSGASWYFARLSCARGLPCDQLADQALDESSSAGSLEVRRNAIARADEAYAANMPFITIASPLRWTLSAARLTGFRPSPFAVHPFNRMRTPRR
jgi:oligopeptide transport system substrate-binding protein